MLSFFKRLWRILTGHAHDLADKFEEPIKMTKQGIRELEEQLDESIKAFAEVRATAIRSKNEVNKAAREAQAYKDKAIALLHKAQKSDNPAEAERLAAEAMAQREHKLQLYKANLEQQKKYDAMVNSMDRKIKMLKSQIAKWKTELKTLEARQKAAKAGLKINQVMAGMDSSKTLESLNRLKEQVEIDEIKSDVYGEMADKAKSIDEEIDTFLGDHEGHDALLALKEEMGLIKKDLIDIKPEKEKETIEIEIERDDSTDA